MSDDAPAGAASVVMVAATTTGDPRRATPGDDRPALGSWWWVTEDGEPTDDYYDLADPAPDGSPRRRWLGCVSRVGSNYAKLVGVDDTYDRVALDDFASRCRPEPDPTAHVRRHVDHHRARVRALLGQIRELCRRLGVQAPPGLATPQDAGEDPAIDDSAGSLALVHGVSDATAYRTSLVRAQEEDLPKLFKEVKEHHGHMATWMKAELIPARVQLGSAEEVVGIVEGKIHLVSLYAGLLEEIVTVRPGAPAAMDDRVHLMQRRHYMDEECLARYEAGGMSFQNIGEFDAWIARDEHFGRILPHPRCVVAFRVRRHDKRMDDYEGDSLSRFIQLWHEADDNRRTYLYVRNGDQLHRLETDLDFGEELFPRREDSELLGDQELWVRPDEHAIQGKWGQHDPGVLTRREFDARMDTHRAKRRLLARLLTAWRRTGRPEGPWAYVAQPGDQDAADHGDWSLGKAQHVRGRPRWPFLPWSNGFGEGHERQSAPDRRYRRLAPEDVYYDDVMRRIRDATIAHNRVAVVLQGLLDRSTCLHPHPPWRLWTPNDFASAVELVYDVSRAVTSGDAPDFEAYRRQLNQSLAPGCHVIGQRAAWIAHMRDKNGREWEKATRYRDRGPAQITRVHRIDHSGRCELHWTRERARPVWEPCPDRPGYRQPAWPEIPIRWVCPADRLTCVDAYTPGDYRIFYDDPRTRADYLTWAPILLACEDWHRKRRLARDEAQGEATAAGTKKTKRRERKRKP